MLYYPYRVNEDTIKKHYPTWQTAYVALEQTIKKNQRKFTFDITPAWGDIDDAMNAIETHDDMLFNINSLENNKEESTKNIECIDEEYEKYDFETDLQYFQCSKNMNAKCIRPYEVIKQPHILENIEYYNIR
jgi:hypothetical protein